MDDMVALQCLFDEVYKQSVGKHSWMVSMPTALAQELRGKELQFGLLAVILICIKWFLA